MTHSPYDVIIAGAGPVGLFLACELALATCSVLILEQAADPDSPLKRLPFGIRGLSAPTIEALDRRGLLDALEVPGRLKHPFVAAAQPQGRRQAGHFAGIPFHHDDIDTAQWTHRGPGSLLAEMAELETVLARRAGTLGVAIRRGAAITGFDCADDSVTVRTADETFIARWLVGCDGARSAVRKAAGFAFAGTEPAFTGYTASVDLDDPGQLKAGRNITATGMYVQSQPGYLALQDFDRGAFHDSGKPVTREHAQQVLRRISGTNVTVRTLHLATTWTDRARQATAYRKGRVLLAGDAAHIHAPLGGQGLNLGLGDAMNLGWKLAATIRGRAPHGLLDTYEAERHPVGARVLDWSRAQVAVMQPDATGRALHAIMRDLIDTRDGATYVAARVWGVNTRYDLGDGHRLTGRSVPDLRFTDGTTIAARLRAGKGLLLNPDGDGGLAALAEELGEVVHHVTDPVEHGAAMLVRPDGIVAWACDGAPDAAEARRAAARWFALA